MSRLPLLSLRRLLHAAPLLLAACSPAPRRGADVPPVALADNPIVRTHYAADPSARVFGDTLFLYPSHDRGFPLGPGADGRMRYGLTPAPGDATDGRASFDMEDYRVYSTTDMLTFDDRGVAFDAVAATPWASGQAWAPDCVERDGRYYLYYPIDRRHIGVAVSDRPTGPFRDALGRPLLSVDTPGVVCDRDFIDPCVLIDTVGIGADGRPRLQAYLFAGQGTLCAVRLGDDMVSYDTTTVVTAAGDTLARHGVYLIEGATEFFEAAWVHRRDGRYYLSYSTGERITDPAMRTKNNFLADPALGRAHQPEIAYAVASSPLGPYTYRGVILGAVSSGTNHHSIAPFRGQWYLFYHTADLSLALNPTLTRGHGCRRSLAVEPLAYDAEGDILPVVPRPAVLPEVRAAADSALQAAFGRDFDDATLRLDYILGGDARRQSVHFLGAQRSGRWAGRRRHMDRPLLRGNGQIAVADSATGRVLYAESFSTLFQEWATGYAEARTLSRAFEHTALVPWPRRTVRVTLTLTDAHGHETARLEHCISPADILIRPQPPTACPVVELHRGDSLWAACDVAIVAEGYTEAEMPRFLADARAAADTLLSYEPFASHRAQFNIRAVCSPSQDSGVSIPRLGHWRRTAVGAHYDTFRTDRYLTTLRSHRLHDLLGGVPAEHVLILVNGEDYGGGGVYNMQTILPARNAFFTELLVHEFAHAFAGLGDEYFYDDMDEPAYFADTEPWEPNLTTLRDFGSKWADLLPPGTPVPTPTDSLETTDAEVRRRWSTFTPDQRARLSQRVGVYEGAGYASRGVYRPAQECMMKILQCRDFCPVCRRAIERTIAHQTR